MAWPGSNAVSRSNPEMHRRSQAPRNHQKTRRGSIIVVRCTEFFPGNGHFMRWFQARKESVNARLRNEPQETCWKQKAAENLSGRKKYTEKTRAASERRCGRLSAPERRKFACGTEERKQRVCSRRVNIDSYCLCDQTKQNEPRKTKRNRCEPLA